MLQKIADAVEARVEELARIIAEETGNALRTQARPEAKMHGRHHPLLRRPRQRAQRRDHPARRARAELHPARADRRGRRHHSLECAGAARRAQDRAGPVRRQHAGAEGGRRRAARRAVARGDLPGAPAQGRAQRRDRATARKRAPRCPRIPDVRKLSFTGSTEVGKLIMRAAAERIVPVSLELGGKSPSIVYPDANEDWVVDGIISAMRFTRQSQSCTAGSRLFLHADIFDEFPRQARPRRRQKLKIGDPLDEATDIGAIINEKQFKKVCGYVEEGLKQPGGKLLFGGLPPKTGPLSKGYFAIPTVFANAANDWRLAREEIFGPVLVAIRWTDEAEAIRMANDTPLWPRRLRVDARHRPALRAAHSIEAGWVQVNQGLGQSPGHSYGGIKQSGIGREFSLEGMLDSFTQKKNVTVNLNTPPRH